MSLVNASELDTSPPEWTVGDSTGSTTGMIPGIGTGFVWGPRTAGKSLVFGIDLGLAIANGTPFMGYPTTRGKVVYCVGEGLYDLGLRKQARLAREARDRALTISRVMAEQGSEAAEALAESLPPYTDDNLFIITEPFTVPLLNPSMEQTASLKKAITTIQRLNTPGPDDDPETFDYVQLVILDSLANFTGRSLSNDSSANLLVSGMQAMCREIEAVVLAIAHPTEKGDKMLGAGRLLNAADFEIEVRPDDNQAPGSLRTASILNHKSKYSALFEPIGYQVEPCEWMQPVEDPETGEPTGEMVQVRSATVRMLETDKPSSAPPPSRQPAPPLPEIHDVERKSRKRSGLKARRNGLHLVTSADLPGAVPVPESAIARKAETAAILDARVTPPAIVPPRGPASAKQELAGALLAVRCPVCSRPNSMSCDVRMQPAPLPLARTASGQAWIHEDRILAAAVDQPDPEGFLEEAIATLSARTAPPRPAPAPAPRRPSWTTVTPDSPAPSLAELGLAGH